MTLGTLVTMPFSGVLASELGWESIFYVQGGLSVLWYILWLIFVYDSPSLHPRISRTEKQMIESSLGTGASNEKVRIASILLIFFFGWQDYVPVFFTMFPI